MRHRIRRATFGKDAIKHSSTLVDNTGPGVGSFFAHVIFKTGVGKRLIAGGIQTVQDSSTTENTCQISDVIKYINICLECSPRGANPTNDNDNAGWLEWAVVWQREENTNPTVANIGVLTLGCIASHWARENCLMTGCFPLGTKQAMAQDIKIKLPVKAVKLHMGDILKIYCFIRTSNSADARTDSHRLIASSHYKVYS